MAKKSTSFDINQIAKSIVEQATVDPKDKKVIAVNQPVKAGKKS